MEHFAPEDWVDFVRHVSSEKTGAAIAAHLATDCPDCVAAHHTWSHFAEFVKQERAGEPSRYVVQLVKTYAAAPPPKRGPLTTVARLVFDSVRHPLPAGFRSVGQACRLLMFQAGPFTIDLQFAPWEDGGFGVIGQIADEGEPPRAAAGVRVTLVDHVEQLVTSRTDAYGQFECLFTPKPGLAIVLGDPEENAVVINLDTDPPLH